MIVSMKKVSVVLQDKDIHSALESLAELGLLHLEHLNVPKGEAIEELTEEHARLAAVLSALGQVKPRPQQDSCAHTKQMFINVFTSLAEIKKLEDRIAGYDVELKRWQPWGPFDPRDIRTLEKHGISVKLYAVAQQRMEEIPEDVYVEPIFEDQGIVRLIAFSLEPLKLDFDVAGFPEHGLLQLQSLRDTAIEQKRELERFVRECARYYDVLIQRLKRIESRMAYQQALDGRGVTDEFSILQGYCPQDQCAAFEKKACEQKWAYLIEDPSEEDHPPTLLRNPKWVELVKPVFQMANILPGYREVDVSIPFLFFFSIFFGILIGDAGYGLVFILLTALGQKKFGRGGNLSAFILLYLLSLMAVIWGVLTGTYFGQNWIAPHVSALSPWLTKNSNVQEVCFFLGALQLSLAHAWRGVLKFPSASAGGQFGWALWIWGMFFLVRQLIIEIPMPPFVPALMGASVAMIIFCSVPDRHILKMLLGGFGEFMGGCINAFTDIISYIRLFAVGLATVAMADAFNDIALGVGFSNVFTGLITALILFAGHALNIVLALMAILVHGLRLNILEFSGHMNIQWSGIGYKPFKREAAGSEVKIGA